MKQFSFYRLHLVSRIAFLHLKGASDESVERKAQSGIPNDLIDRDATMQSAWHDRISSEYINQKKRWKITHKTL